MSSISSGTTSTTTLIHSGDTTGNLVFQTNNTGSGGTEAMRIDTSQNVGIGTTSPGALFNVDGKASDAVALFTNNGTASAGGNGFRVGIDNSLNAYVNNSKAGPLVFYTSNAERMRIDSSGNVGIGATPSSEQAATRYLQVSDSTSYSTLSLATTRTVSTNYRIGSIAFEMPNNTATYRTRALIEGYMSGSTANKYGGYITFATAADNSSSLAEAMRIDSTAVVLIGTTSVLPTYSTASLQVSGGGGQGAATFRGTSGTAGYEVIQVWKTPNSGDNKLVAWLTDSTASERGNIYYNRAGNAIVYATTSDARLKQNIVDAPSALEKINSVKIRSFDWIENGNHVDFGVIAQELKLVAPESVSDEVLNDDGSIRSHMTASPAVLVPALIKAVQELKAIVDAQATEIAEMKAART